MQRSVIATVTDLPWSVKQLRSVGIRWGMSALLTSRLDLAVAKGVGVRVDTVVTTENKGRLKMVL